MNSAWKRPRRRQRKANKRMTRRPAAIHADQIEQAILLIRGQRVLLDRDLAALYGVETKNLNRAVKRNLDARSVSRGGSRVLRLACDTAALRQFRTLANWLIPCSRRACCDKLPA